MNKKYYLGIDGGGTKTGMTLIDGTGKIMATLRGPSSAIIGDPSQESIKVLQDLMQKVFTSADISKTEVTRCAIGINGIDFQDEIEMQHREVSLRLGLEENIVFLNNDAVAALWGASEKERSAVFQIGTGFTSAYRNAYGEETLFDHLDTGKTYDIRLELIKTISRMIDGRAERTPVFEKVMNAFGIEDEALYREQLYRNRIPQSVLLSTAALVYEAWQEGDKTAEKIMQEAENEYVLAARAMIRKIGTEDVAMVFGGGVIINAPQRLWDNMARRIKEEFPGVAVHAPILPPEHGAVLWAAFIDGESPQKLFNVLKEQYE